LNCRLILWPIISGGDQSAISGAAGVTSMSFLLTRFLLSLALIMPLPLPLVLIMPLPLV
jgi:hypothetical protein